MQRFKNERVERIIHWILFNVMIALLPIVSNGLKFLTFHTRPVELNFSEILIALCGGGELLLISTAISGAAIGEIMSMEKGLFKTVVVGCSIFLIVFSSSWYAMLAGEQIAVERSIIATGSLIVWCSTVVTSASGIFVANFDPKN